MLDFYNHCKKDSAFTFIEMLIVVVTIGILAAALIPRLTGAQERSPDAACNVKVGQIATAIDIYKEEKGSYPIAPFHADVSKQSTVAMIPDLQSYMSSIPTDPGKGLAAVRTASASCVFTGDSFAYSSDASGTIFAITSLSDAKKGNTANC